MTPTSCGVLVTGDGMLLIGQATGSPRWDIPKGLAEAGEDFAAAAARELDEETGLLVAPDALHPLGVHRYLPGKQLALFVWRPEAMPEPASLCCRSLFRDRQGRMVPEISRFAVLPWAEALGRLGKNMVRVLTGLEDAVQLSSRAVARSSSAVAKPKPKNSR